MGQPSAARRSIFSSVGASEGGRGAALARPHAAEDGPPRGALGWPMLPFILIFLFMVLFDTLGR